MVHKILQLHKYFKHAEIDEMYATIALRSFAIAIIGIFIPAILLSNNYSIIDVLVYYLVMCIMTVATFFLAIQAMRYLGVKHTMLLNIPALLLLFYFIYTIQNSWSIYLMASVHALSVGFFWSAFHIEFARVSHIEKSGSEVGMLTALTEILAVISPITGGFILFYYGDGAIALISAVFAIASAVPLLLSKDEYIKVPLRIGDLFKNFSTNRAIAFFSEGARNMSAIVLWPMYITIAGISALALGGIYTVVRIIIITMSYIIGKASDKLSPKHILRVGTFIHSITMFIRGFLSTLGSFVAITTIGSIGYVTFNVPMQKMYYGIAKQLGPLFVIQRELYLELGKISMIVLVLCVYLYTYDFIVASVVGFMCAGIATLCLNYIE
jgi:MFS family permease